MRTVVGAAVVRGARVLAARRTAPAEAAGRWEFPGGKVEPGERPDDALVREIAEELDCDIEVTGWLQGAVPIGETHVLTVASARLVRGEPDPGAVDAPGHDLVRWLAADELDEVDWLEPDRPFLPELSTILRAEAARLQTSRRGIFFEEDDALAVAGRLAADGWAVEVLRERYQGEDDDEDHPWAVVTDAPDLILEVLVDEHDGWLDVPDDVPAAPPLDLPTAPKRIKRDLG